MVTGGDLQPGAAGCRVTQAGVGRLWAWLVTPCQLAGSQIQSSGMANTLCRGSDRSVDSFHTSDQCDRRSLTLNFNPQTHLRHFPADTVCKDNCRASHPPYSPPSEATSRVVRPVLCLLDADSASAAVAGWRRCWRQRLHVRSVVLKQILAADKG